MSDDALVTFDFAHQAGAAVPFHDVGYMPVNQLTIAGHGQELPSGPNGIFISYSGDGVQNLATGTVDYTSLHYELVSYKGPHATFSHLADGTPVVNGAHHQIVLAQGDLIPGQGHLQFNPSGGINGQLNASMQIDGKTVGALDISVYHAAGDVHPILGKTGQLSGLTLDQGTLHAIFVPLTVG